MAASNQPLIVLVHGAWHGAWCWAALQAELDLGGVPSLAIDLPGHGVSGDAFTDLHGDADAVTQLLGRLDRPVILVGHSYGGAVITQAAAGRGDVTHLVYLTAYVPDVGESVIDMTRSMPEVDIPLGKAMVIADGASTIDPAKAAAVLYNRCDPNAAAASAARLCPQPFATFTQAASVAAWRSIPSTYVRCTDDMGIHITHQDLMAARCTHVQSLDTDHSPFLSMPVQTAGILVALAS